MNPSLVDCVIEDQRWEDLPIADLAERAARATLTRLDLTLQGFEIVLLAANDARLRALNAEFRNRDAATNVLSWPSVDRAAEAGGGQPQKPQPGQPDDPEHLGDIALAWETCMREAEAADRAPENHVTHLVVHGVLHLLGYDHFRDGDAAVMETLEVEILASMGVADPYEGAGFESPI